jgi:hypothetical protein
MSVVVAFPPPEPDVAPDVPTDRARRAVKSVSRPMSWLFTGLFGGTLIACLAFGLAVLFYDGPLMQTRPGGMVTYLEPPPPVPLGETTIGALPLVQRLAMVGSGILMMGPAVMILWSLRGLFALYGRGVILEVQNARRLAAIGVWLIAYAVGPTLGHLLVSAAGFDDRGWLRVDSLQALFLGLVLFVIARVMRLGAEINDDASRFV